MDGPTGNKSNSSTILGKEAIAQLLATRFPRCIARRNKDGVGAVSLFDSLSSTEFSEYLFPRVLEVLVFQMPLLRKKRASFGL